MRNPYVPECESGQHDWRGAMSRLMEVYQVCDLCGAEKWPPVRQRLVTGIEDGDDGQLLVYLDARHRNRYVETWDWEAQQNLRRYWRGGQPFTVMVDESLVQEAR